MSLKFDIEKTPPGSEEINAEIERLNSELTTAKKKKFRLLQVVVFYSLVALATLSTLYFQGMIERDTAFVIAFTAIAGALALAGASASAGAAVAVGAVGAFVVVGAVVGAAGGAGAGVSVFLFIKITEAIEGFINDLKLLEPASDELSPEILALCEQNEVVLAYQNALPRPKRPLLQAEYLAMKAWVDGAKSRMAMTEKARQVEAASNQLKQYIELNTAS